MDAQQAWLTQHTKPWLKQVPLIGDWLSSASVAKKTQAVQQGVVHGLRVLWGTLVLVGLKGISLLVSGWVFVFAGLLGAMDGLLARYIRTHEGGRESTFIFHRVADTVIKAPVALFFVYLALPVFINPEWVVIAMSLMVFAFFYLATANLKKFL